MIEQKKSHNNRNKLVNRIILLSIFVLYFVFRMLWDLNFFHSKPYVIDRQYFYRELETLGSTIINSIWDKKRGVMLDDYNSSTLITIIDTKEFVSGLQEAAYEIPTQLLGRKGYMKGYFDAGVFKILVQDNFCFIRADLDKAGNYLSRNPSRSKNDIARAAAHRSRRLFEIEGTIKAIRSQYGYKVDSPSSAYFMHVYLGNFDMNSPIVFTEKMNELYILLFHFKNDPPISIGVFP